MHTDKRIIKTRTHIKNAFMELVSTREMSKISVSELAEKALVNRSTFYLHYEDVPSVAADIEKDIANRITSAIGDFNVTDIYDSTYNLFKALTDRLDEIPLMRKYIIFSTNSVVIISRLKDIFVEKMKSSIKNRYPMMPEKKMEYALTYAASGIIDSYVKWVRNDGSNMTICELIKEVSEITEPILASVTKF